MKEKHIGKCPKCGQTSLYELEFTKAEGSDIMVISIPCSECAHDLEWDFLPKPDHKFVSYCEVK